MLSYPLVTLAEVKAFLGVTNDKMNLRYNLLIKGASDEIERQTGRWLTYQPHTEYFTARDNVTYDYQLSGGTDGYMPVITGISGLAGKIKTTVYYMRGINIDPNVPVQVWYDPNANTTNIETPYGDDTALVLGTDFIVDYENDSILVFAATQYGPPRSLKVTYTAGYPFAEDPDVAGTFTLSAAIEDRLKLAAITQIQFMNVKLRNENIGMGSERTSNKRDTVSATPFLANSGLTPEVARMVTFLKRVKVGRG